MGVPGAIKPFKMASWYVRVSNAPPSVTLAISGVGKIWPRDTGSRGADNIADGKYHAYCKSCCRRFSGATFDRMDASTGGISQPRSVGPVSRTPSLMWAADFLEEYRSQFQALMRAEIGATDLWGRFNIDLARSHLQ